MTANEIRAEIFELLKRIPPSLSSAGVMRVREYKDAAEKAKKAALAGKSSIETLRLSLMKLKNFHEGAQ